MTVTQARGPNSVPRAHMNNQGRAVPVCNPSPGAGEETENPQVWLPASLA